MRPLSLLAAVWAALILAGCTCSSDSSEHDAAQRWVPSAGRPSPVDTPALTPDQLVAAAYWFNPRIGERGIGGTWKFEELYEKSPERARAIAAQRTAWARLEQWLDMVADLVDALPGYWVNQKTNPSSTTYTVEIVKYIGDRAPSPEHERGRGLLVEVSILVPYYFIHERDYEYTDGRFSYGPIRYRVTAAMKPALAALERAMAAHYGYRRLNPEVARTPVPGIYINGYYEARSPTLRDALFAPHNDSMLADEIDPRLAP
ncbi:MAG: hypothetical protein AAGC55_08940 [Myxococcota bacterium]